jgi:hypothetical protein
MGTVNLRPVFKFKSLSAYLAIGISVLPLFLQWPLFWDNLPYVGGIADYFFQHGIISSIFHLPKDWDVAHSPLFAAMLAISWKVFGKSLFVSYCLQFPFVFLSFFCLFELLGMLRTQWWVKGLFAFMLLSDTVVFTQINQLGYEWIMLAPFMICLLKLFQFYSNLDDDSRNGIMRRYGIWIWFLPFTQLRGLNMVGMLVGISFVLICLKSGIRKAFQVLLKKDIWIILGAALLTFSWLLIHKINCGYWTNATGTAWSGEHLIPSSFIGFMYKLVLSVWRLFDYGFITYFVLSLFTLVWFYPQKEKYKFLFTILPLVAISFFSLALQFSFFDIPICHRYFLVLHLIYPIAFIGLVLQLRPVVAIILMLICCLGVGSGYFWEYPEKMANGREVQASSMYYFPLRDSVEKYMRRENISSLEVVSHFPICVPNDWVKLSNTNQGALCGDIDTAQNPRFILYTNFSNGFTNAEKDGMRKMKKVRFWKNGPIQLILFRCH